MKVLVTGINGFVGKHLTKELKGRNHQVFGTGREEEPAREISSQLDGYTRCDLTKADDVAIIPLDSIDSIVSLAGLAKVGDSFKHPDAYNMINVAVLTVLGNRLIREKSQASVLAISTGGVYDPNQDLPLSEYSIVTHKGSPYATSKLLMEKAVEHLRQNGLRCVVVRPFNHIGPGQESGFLVPDLYEKIEKSLKTGQPVEVGNLKTKRDYTDVRDVVRAYTDLAERKDLSFDIYNVCSSKSTEGQEILDRLLGLTKAKGKVDIRVNQQFIRASDPGELYGNNDRLQQETGWEPNIRLEKTLHDFVEKAKLS